MLRFLTAGESHGPQLTVIVEGVPAGLRLDARRDIDPHLRRRQGGYGRGKRQQIEHDRAEIVAGVRGGLTLGSPVALVITNRDWDNWRGPMQVTAAGFKRKQVSRVRPGHADLAGMLKYDLDDARDVLERASARETAARVAAGAVAIALLGRLGVQVSSWVQRIGAVAIDWRDSVDPVAVEASPVRCPDPGASERMVAAIDGARERGDTLGGSAVVTASGVVAGLGSYAQWDRKLDGLIAQALCSIPSVKGVEIGAAVVAARSPGSQVHDSPRYVEGEGFRHLSNRQGGLTGGVTDGEPVWATVHFKPISTLLAPLRSVDAHTGAEVNAHYERSDICVVPAGAVVAEAMLGWVIAAAMAEKLGGDSLAEMRRNLAGYRRSTRRLR
ncbi:MAG: chorismate synthase [Candidatus Dormibacteria bacterium]|jgi:chorismate synthase